MHSILLLVTGLGLLVLGGEALVRGASRLARGFGVSSLLIGLTVVAFGTSAPELAVSARAALEGEPDVAVGNVVGSNIFNVLVILGASALIRPLRVAHSLVRIEAPLVVAASGLLWLLAADARVSRTDGVILLLGLLAYGAWSVRQGRGQRKDAELTTAASVRPSRKSFLADLILIALGIVLLVLGARWAVDGAVSIADALGVSRLVVGLTVVSAGTSLPELATSLVATRRGERDIAVGNVMGSNLFNILGIMGVAAILSGGTLEIPQVVLTVDIPLMTSGAILGLAVLYSNWEVSRREGIALIGLYVLYVGYLAVRVTVLDPQPAGGALALGVAVLGMALAWLRYTRRVS
jgi:cation:H+ antiporter